MKKRMILTFVMLLCMISVVYAVPKTMIVTWDNNTEQDLAGYNLYITDSNGTELLAPIVLPYTASDATPVTVLATIDVPEFAETTVCAFANAYDSSGNLSANCEQVCHTIDLAPPGPPTGLDWIIQVIVAFFKAILSFLA